jgi:hypothetical protein
LVVNGEFEATGEGWTLLAGPAQPAYATELTFNRSRQALRLGITDGPNLPSISSVVHVSALPTDASSIILSFRYYPLYERQPGPGDLQYVDVYNVDTGQYAGRALGAQEDDRVWRAVNYDLTAQAGQNIRLTIGVNNDGVQGRTAMYMDNVSIVACDFANLVSPGAQEDAPRASARGQGADAPILLAGRPSDPAGQIWLARLTAMGVLAGVAGVIALAATVFINLLRNPD